MPTKKRRVLEVVFAVGLHKTLDGITPGGANFSFKFLKGFDLDRRTIVLSGDFDFCVKDGVVIFTGRKPDMPQLFVASRAIFCIKDHESKKVLLVKICLVTTNYGKFVSFKTVFEPHGIEIEHINKELPEKQSNNLVEIAKEKVLAAYALVKKPVIAQDTGFYLSAWNEFSFPGPMVKFTPAPILLALVENRIRACEFRECLAYTDDGKNVKIFSGKVSGSLSAEPRGGVTKEAWSGLWQIFVPEGQAHTVAEMTGEERAEWRKKRGNNSAQKFAKWFLKNSR